MSKFTDDLKEMSMEVDCDFRIGGTGYGKQFRRMLTTPGYDIPKTRIRIAYGDIALANADVIVNASNGCGYMGGKRCRKQLRRGVAESLNYHTNGKIEDESLRKARRFRKIPAWLFGVRAGGCFVTASHGLDCKCVFHAVTMRQPGSRANIKHIIEVLGHLHDFMTEHGYQNVAMPLLGSGTGGLSSDEVMQMIIEWAQNHSEYEIQLFVKENHDGNLYTKR